MLRRIATKIAIVKVVFVRLLFSKEFSDIFTIYRLKGFLPFWVTKFRYVEDHNTNIINIEIFS